MPNVPMHFTIKNFEGPLDLLLHLIEREEIDIYDIPVALIADQYMEYMAGIEEIDLEHAGEFLVMAASLLEMKSRTLLPKQPKLQDEEEEEGKDPREELVQQLLEYKRYKEAAESMRTWEELRQRMFTRYPAEYVAIRNGPAPLAPSESSALVAALKRVLDSVGDTTLVSTVKKERISIRVKMTEIWHRVKANPDGLEFKELFEEPLEKMQVVVSFLAILELLRLRRINVKQTQNWGEIYLYPFKEEEDTMQAEKSPAQSSEE